MARPRRRCVGCYETREKKELMRFVVDSRGVLRYDDLQRRSGRGAYLCVADSCLQAAFSQNRFQRSMRRRVVVNTTDITGIVENRECQR